MRVGVLGPIQVEPDDGPARPITSRAQALILSVLAVRPGVTTADALVDAVWSDDPPRAALSSLRAQVSRLRKRTGGVVESQADGYQLAVAPDDVDARRFARLVADADGAQPATALGLVDEALALWRGPAFGDLADEAPLVDEARRLEQARTDARQARAEALHRLGRWRRAVVEAEDVLAADPYRERLWAVLIRSLAADGRAADAMRAGQRAADALAEIGLTPGAELRDAEQAALADAPTPPPPVTSSRPPVPPTELVGRSDELARVIELLDDVRVVTLVGPGGVGKTRLALAVADGRCDRHRLGVRVVELAAVTVGDDEAVADAVAQGLGLADADALDGAGDLDVLLVLDNCEHVIDGVAAVVSRLVGRGRHLRIVATSREGLAVAGEHVVPLAPLDTSSPSSAAVDLFWQRARAAGSSDGFDRAVAARIASRLDGLPLAIEMAAARLSAMTLDELADAVEHDIGGLRQRRRDSDERHRTLQAVLEWSEQLLDDDLRRALADISVFAGAVGRRDVIGVLGDDQAVDRADELVERSLLTVDRAGGHSAYRMLDTVRDHARARLADQGRLDDLAAAHARWYADQLADIDTLVRGPDEAAAHTTFALLFDEVRAAHRWARGHDVDLAAEMGERAHVTATAGLRGEMSGWLDELAAVVTRGSATERRVRAALAPRLATVGRLDEARRHALAVLDGGDDDVQAMLALEAMSDASLFSGDLDASFAAGRRLYEVARSHGDPYFEVTARVNEALALGYGGDVDGGLAWVEGTDDRFPSGGGWLAYGRGEVVLDHDVDAALDDLDLAVRVAVDVGNRFLAGVAMVSAGSLRARAADPAAAVGAFVDLLDHYADTGDRSQQLTTLKNLVVLLTRLDEAAAAIELAAVVTDDPTSPTYGDEAEHIERALAGAEAALGAADAARARDAAAGRSVDEAAAIARAVLTGG